MADKSFEERLKEYQKSMMITVDKLDVDDIKSSGVSLRFGNKIYNLVPAEDEVVVLEDQVKFEIQQKLMEKRTVIKDTIKGKMAEVSAMVSSIQDEYERKERLMKDTMAKSAPMPEITWEHAKKGLSVVKGSNRGEIIWLAKRVYNPKFVDHKPIEPLYIKKLMTNIYIRVITSDKKVTSVSSHYLHNLEFFDHYHQSRPDCWGNWRYPTTWEKVDDIQRLVNDAVAVMENINTMSLAKRNPLLLPRIDTLLRHVTTTVPRAQDLKVEAAGLREGLGSMADGEDIWGN